MSEKLKLQVEGLTYEYGFVIGNEALYARLPRYNFPVGFIWYNQILVKHVNIGYIWVHEFFRRRGIATAMLLELRDTFDGETICTAVGNPLSEPWLKSNGFSHEPAGWFLRPQSPLSKMIA